MENTKLSSDLRTVISKMYKRLRKQMYSMESLSISEITVLAHLIQDVYLSPTEIAQLLKIKNQSVSQILNHLSELNYIQRISSENDKRKVSVSLTETGKKMIEKNRYERDEWLSNNIKNNLSMNEIEILKQAIEIINKLADSE